MEVTSDDEVENRSYRIRIISQLTLSGISSVSIIIPAPSDLSSPRIPKPISLDAVSSKGITHYC